MLASDASRSAPKSSRPARRNTRAGPLESAASALTLAATCRSPNLWLGPLTQSEIHHILKRPVGCHARRATPPRPSLPRLKPTPLFHEPAATQVAPSSPYTPSGRWSHKPSIRPQRTQLPRYESASMRVAVGLSVLAPGRSNRHEQLGSRQNAAPLPRDRLRLNMHEPSTTRWARSRTTSGNSHNATPQSTPVARTTALDQREWEGIPETFLELSRRPSGAPGRGPPSMGSTRERGIKRGRLIDPCVYLSNESDAQTWLGS